MPVDLHAFELALMAPDESERKITALISVAAGPRRSETVMFKLRSVLRRLRAREYSLTIEHGLGAIGIAIAVASSAFASYMISQDHQGQRRRWRSREEGLVELEPSSAISPTPMSIP